MMTASPITPLYLPISASTLERLKGDEPETAIEDMTTPELAAALVLVKLPQSRLTGPEKIEKLLSTAIATANESIGEAGINPLRGVLLRDLDSGVLDLTMAQLSDHGLLLMDDAEVRSRRYLSALGEWDHQYRFRRHAANPIVHERPSSSTHTIRLTDPQLRVSECLLLNRDDPLHVQGYAGTGKTHLLASLIDMLSPPNRPLVLCQTQQQIRAIQQRVPHSQARLLTFQMLALEGLDQLDRLTPYQYPYSRPEPHRMSPTAQISDAEIARYLGFTPLGRLKPPSIANLCRRMIMSFCAGPASQITEATIPKGIDLSQRDRDMLVSYAIILWKHIINAPRAFPVPIRAYHLIKLLALCGYGIPESFTHVIVDESHDLSVPMIQVLERSRQAFITLGDDLQSLSGHVVRHSSTIRQREIGQAVRAGVEMESVLTPLIHAHPLTPPVAYKGNRSIGTQLTHYDSLRMPSTPTTVLVKDMWGLLEWFMRMSPEEGAYGFLLLGNRHQFHTFALDLIELHNHGRRPRHGMLFRHDSWDSLRQQETAAGNKAFERIARRLEKGLTAEQFDELFRRTGTDDRSGYRLALVNEVRNLEFDSVMLAPDLLPKPQVMTEIERGKLLSAIYTGASRARHQIIVPGYLADWVSDLKRLSATTGS